MAEEQLTPAELEQTLDRIARLELDAKLKQEEAGMLKDYLRGFEPGTYKYGKYVLKISSNKRLDDKLAQKVLDADLYKMVSKTTLDTAMARVTLGDEVLESITKVYDNKVEVLVQ